MPSPHEIRDVAFLTYQCESREASFDFCAQKCYRSFDTEALLTKSLSSA